MQPDQQPDKKRSTPTRKAEAAGRTPVENVENVEATDTNSTNSTNSTAPHTREHPIPPDSILADFVAFARDFSEAPDSFSVAPILAVCGGILTPAAWWDFAGRKYPNLFQFVAGPPGVRKSTSFTLAKRIARLTLDPKKLHEGNASDSAAFAKWEDNPHRLQIEDEGNTILSHWTGSHAGRELANRYLKLYDGEPWSQTYRHQGDGDGGQSMERTIDCATLSLCIGATLNVCRLNGVENKRGLRRRFGYYVGEKKAKRIDWPRRILDDDLKPLADGFRKLSDIQGAFQLDKSAWRVWQDIQRENDAAGDSLEGSGSLANEIIQAELSEAPSRILKLAAIFRACRWAKTGKGDPLEVDRDSLMIAALHQQACLEASQGVELIAHRSENSEEAERILATLQSEATDKQFEGRWKVKSGKIVATKSDLTRRFAANANRRMTTHRLHNEIMPAVIRKSGGRTDIVDGTTIYRIPLERPNGQNDRHKRGII